jgi:hypothetical protein
MTLEPAQHAGKRTAVELLDDDGHQVATIYATRAGLHIACAPRYELDGNGLAVEVQQPTGLQVAFTRR